MVQNGRLNFGTNAHTGVMVGTSHLWMLSILGYSGHPKYFPSIMVPRIPECLVSLDTSKCFPSVMLSEYVVPVWQYTYMFYNGGGLEPIPSHTSKGYLWYVFCVSVWCYISKQEGTNGYSALQRISYKCFIQVMASFYILWYYSNILYTLSMAELSDSPKKAKTTAWNKT